MSRVYKVHGDAVCEMCGNSGCQCFEVQVGGERHVFDSFECALDALSPVCAYCGSPFVGQGVLYGGLRYCSNNCVSDLSLRKYGLQRLLGEQLHLQDATVG